MEASLAARFDAIEARLSALEGGLPAAPSAAPPPPVALPPSEAPASPTQARLAAELSARGVPHAFKRVPSDYYDHDLEWRRRVLTAPSTAHLCKSLLLENTRHRPPPPGTPLTPTQTAALCRFVLVIVQYEARFDAERLRKHMIALAAGAAPAKAFNLRLASVADSDAVTGYTHNAVTPVGLATAGVPIVLSSAVAALSPPAFWMWGGEVDLKLGVDTAQFVAAYDALVLDVTHGDGGAGGGGGDE